MMLPCTYHIFPEKDILIASLQEDLENATNREMTQMSGHEEAAAILPLHYSTSTNYDDDEDDDDGNLQEMCQVCVMVMLLLSLFLCSLLKEVRLKCQHHLIMIMIQLRCNL